MALVRKTSIQTLIDTNLATGKTPKISPADHRVVAQEIVDYIDNTVLTTTQGVAFAGSYNFSTNGAADYKFTVTLGTTVATPDYVVIGCITSAISNTNNCRYFYTIKDRGVSQFDLLLRARNPATANLTFEYLLFAKEEIDN